MKYYRFCNMLQFHVIYNKYQLYKAEKRIKYALML